MARLKVVAGCVGVVIARHLALFTIDDGLDNLREIIAHLHQLGAALGCPLQLDFTIPSIRIGIVVVATIPLVVIDIDKVGVRVFKVSVSVKDCCKPRTISWASVAVSLSPLAMKSAYSFCSEML